MTDQRPVLAAAPNTSIVRNEPDAPGAAGAGAAIAQVILDLAGTRGAGKSICPSEAARVVAGQAGAEVWQRFMKPVRQAAIRLARDGQIEILRKGRPVIPPEPPDDVRGVIRLRIVPQAQPGVAASSPADAEKDG